MSRLGRQVSLGRQADRHAADGARQAVSRAVPYIAPWAAWLMVPWLAILARVFIWATGATGAVITPLACLGATALLIRHTWKSFATRDNRTRRHAAASVGAALTWVDITTVTGIVSPTDWRWLPWVPNPWVWGCWAFCGAVGCLAWSIRRAGQPEDGEDGGKLQDALGLAMVKVGEAQAIGSRVEIQMKARPGATNDDIRDAKAKVEAYVGVPEGLSRYVPSGTAGRGTLVLIVEDVLRRSLPWSLHGPSAPGGSVTDGARYAWREDDVPRTVYVCGLDQADSHLGVMGLTRTGKTLAVQVICAEFMTRRDCRVIWIDPVKCHQSMAPLAKGLLLAADTKQKASLLAKALVNVVTDRVRRMGQAGYRVWTPRVFEHLGLPRYIVVVSEADAYIDSEDWVYLTSKAQSAGISLIIDLQRASATSMPTDLRYNVGQWLCFGTGDSYSAAFALTDRTLNAGADPHALGLTCPGKHWAELLAETPQEWTIPARGLLATDPDLVGVVALGQQWQPPAAATDIAAFGRAWEVCQPGNVTDLFDVATPATPDHVATDDATVRHPVIDGEVVATRSTEESEDAMSDSGIDTTETMQEMQDEVDMPDREAGPIEDLDIDPRQPIPPYTGPTGFADPLADTPEEEAMDARMTPDMAAAMFDDMLRQVHNAGREIVSVGDMFASQPVAGSRSITWWSRRLADVVEGRVSPPPGLTLERIPGRAGMYKIIYTGIIQR